MAAKRHHKSVSEGYYAGESARVRMEHHDGGMIMEDRSAVANLPQNVMMKPWAREYDYMPENLRDDIRSVDDQINMDGRDAKKHMVPKKV
jgi:hypothetical protein